METFIGELFLAAFLPKKYLLSRCQSTELIDTIALYRSTGLPDSRQGAQERFICKTIF
jgi:hypothetical protein